MRPDGRPHTVCRSHGGLTPPYEDRPIGAAGKERIAASMRAYWQRVKAGLVIRPATSKRAAQPTPETWRRLPPETQEARRARIIRELQERWPDQDWS